MKTDFKTRQVEGAEDAPTVAYKIDPANVAHITSILRGMYADPALAVVREYVSNAFDIHQQHGITRPVEVDVPTYLNSVLRVRDFGPGLSKEDTENLLYSYGSSGSAKRESNTQIGGFGIGCKCAFSLASSFTYTIFHGGLVRIWSCFLDEHDAGQAALQAERAMEADELPGVLVEVPIPPSHFVSIQQALQKAFEFCDRPLKIQGLPAGVQLVKPAAAAYAEDAELTIGNETLSCKIEVLDPKDARAECRWVQGDFGYVVDQNQLPPAFQPHRSYLNLIRVRVPTGTVQLAPSREDLQYSGRTKGVLSKVLGHATSDEFIQRILDSATKDKANMREKARALALAAGISRTIGSSFKMTGKGSFKGLLSASGDLLMPVDKVPTLVEEIASVSLNVGYPSRLRRRRRYSSNPPPPTPPACNHYHLGMAVSVHKDPAGVTYTGANNAGGSLLTVCCAENYTTTILRAAPGVVKSARELVQQWISSKVPQTDAWSPICTQGYLDGSTVTKWLKDNNLPTRFLVVKAPDDAWAELKKNVTWLDDGSFEVEEITAPLDTEIYWHGFGLQNPADTAAGRRRAARQSNGTNYSQHVRKFVQLKTSPSSDGVCSQSWEPVTAIKRGAPVPKTLLVPHAGFRPVLPKYLHITAHDLRQCHCMLPDVLINLVAELRKIKVLGPDVVILGVKASDYDDVKAATKLPLFWDWLSEEVEKRKWPAQAVADMYAMLDFFTGSRVGMSPTVANLLVGWVGNTAQELRVVKLLGLLPEGPLKRLIKSWRVGGEHCLPTRGDFNFFHILWKLSTRGGHGPGDWITKAQSDSKLAWIAGNVTGAPMDSNHPVAKSWYSALESSTGVCAILQAAQCQCDDLDVPDVCCFRNPLMRPKGRKTRARNETLEVVGALVEMLTATPELQQVFADKKDNTTQKEKS